MIIGEGDEFEEIEEFVARIEKRMESSLEWCRNEDVLTQANHKLGAIIKVKNLNERNQKELKRIEFKEDEFPFAAESYTGNHLMKTVVFNEWLERHKFRL